MDFLWVFVAESRNDVRAVGDGRDDGQLTDIRLWGRVRGKDEKK